MWLASGAVAVRLAIGWAQTPGGGRLDGALRLADDRMNADRRRMKALQPAAQAPLEVVPPPGAAVGPTKEDAPPLAAATISAAAPMVVPDAPPSLSPALEPAPPVAAEAVALAQPVVEAATEGAKLRFRPILMTSFAFNLGVLPLVIATGAGAAGREALGTAVFGGMIAATIFPIFFVPVLYTVFQGLTEWLEKRKKPIPK
jgi:hypothetical protein